MREESSNRRAIARGQTAHRASPRAPRPASSMASVTACVALAAALAAGCRDPTAGPGRLSGKLPPLPVYVASHVEAPPRIDGRLDDPVWRAAAPVELVSSLTGEAPRYRTEARLVWDDAALYVAFDCEDDLVWARPGRKDDDALWKDEVVEIFLDPSGAGHDYVEIELSPAGVRFDARFARWRSDLSLARAWDSRARTAAAVRGELTIGDAPPQAARGWSAELALPWPALGLERPRAGLRWRMNLYRLETHNLRGITESSAFSPPMRGDFHALDRFGWLELR